METIDKDFDGVFRFSNNSDEDFKALWNNKEYIFPAHTRSPMLIQNESLENIQEIRKRFAYKWAEREWFKSAEYLKMSKMGNGLPPTRQDKVLEPLIQQCLEPLPLAKAIVRDGPKNEVKLRGSKVVKDGGNLNEAFRDDEPVQVGEQANSMPKL